MMSERRGKYNARPTTIDGILFDSHAEAARYQDLVLMTKAGIISGITCHPRFEIVPKDKHGRALYYEADFQYMEFDTGRLIVEDVKGVKTALYLLKKRLFLAQYPCYVFREV